MVVQSDRTVLLEVDNPGYQEARDALARFAELEKSPEHIHTYRLSPLSLWNAAASGLSAEAILDALARYSKYDIPGNIQADVRDYVSRFGRLKLRRAPDGGLLLSAEDPLLMLEVSRQRKVSQFIIGEVDERTVQINPAMRGHIKKALVDVGFPAEDLAGYVDGAPLPIHLLEAARANGKAFNLRHYQRDAVETFYADGSAQGGSGVVVLPCGAGKTIVGMGVMEQLQTNTLILTTNTVAVRQWIDELHDKTSLATDEVGEYTGDVKEIKPVTITTYQILTYHKRRPRAGDEADLFDDFGTSARPFTPDDFPHFQLFNQRDWGLIVYDEVHLLPAPMFRMTAELQGRRRLGLTATLVREDGKEDHVFALIGPKKYDVPWKDLERQGWIATAYCHEIRLDMAPERRFEYALAESREQYRLAATDPAKMAVVQQLIAKHPDDQVLVIGTYLDQLTKIAALLDAPLLTGKTPVRERQALYRQMREGTLRCLVVSKVANFAIDLPDVSVAIEVSGTFGSRQEEAQRLGRILRPKSDDRPAHFYAIVMRDTRDQLFAANRQMFLTEQGYKYEILYHDDLVDYDPAHSDATW
ncbi:MAG: Type III restriction enzyme, res subunit [Chloroflexi bacterium ADurb.Bin325]|nr:MAG: Type III restriction enzyme, res subunit [Chloroflexi bacterium ADurb.Bin325]